MSDFFTRLAARTLGLAPTLQPIIAPIFAQEQSLQQADTGLLEAFVEEETPARSGDAIQHDELEQRQHSVSQSVSVPSSESSLASLPVTEERDLSQGDRHILRANQQPIPMHMSSASEPFQKASIPITTREAYVVHEEIAVDGTIPAQKELFSTGSPDEQRWPEARSAHPLPPIERSTSVPATQEHGEAILARDQTSAYHTIGQNSATGDGRTPFVPSVVSRTSAQRKVEMPPAQKQPEQPPPTIQVTIGRVEVRATPPPSVPATARQAPAPAVKSLDDYLRQREEGRVR